MTAYLEQLRTDGQNRRWELISLTTLGRDASCTIPLLDEALSRKHAQIERRGNAYFAQDLGSRNGTLLNGAPLTAEIQLHVDDEIVVGNLCLRFVDESARVCETKPLAGQDSDATDFRIEQAMPLDASAPLPQDDVQRRLHALLELGRMLADGQGAESFTRAALALVRQTLHADRVVLAHTDAQGALLLPYVLEPSETSSPSRTLLLRVAAGNEALLCSSGDNASILSADTVVRQGVRALMAAPLRTGAQVLGVLYVDRLTTGSTFTSDDLAFVVEVARQLSGVLFALQRAEDASEHSAAWQHVAAASLTRSPHSLVGTSAPLQAAVALAQRAAQSNAPVLLQGETGTGKELFARMVHDHSPRAQGPYVAINCAAVPAALLESELFGHEKGAFTGASKRHRGLFELASGGTLFLDEIGDMPLELQAKLLRVLESGTLRRVGAESEVQVDVRVVAATHRDLNAAVASGGFRQDLFYRLHVLCVDIPPLRARPGDAVVLAEHFARTLGPRYGNKDVAFTPAALAALATAPWPGNVRELRNVIERALVLCESGQIDAAGLHLGPRTTGAPLQPANHVPGSPGPISIAEAERRAIINALAHCSTKGEAAKLLGIAHPTLNRKIKQYGLDG